MVLVLKFWKPKTIMRLEGDKPMRRVAPKQHSGGEIFMAWLPYLLLVVFVLAWGEPAIKAALDSWTNSLLPAFLPLNATRAERAERARPAQPDHADPAGDADAGAVRRGLHAQLAERVGHGLLPRQRRRRDSAARHAEAVRRAPTSPRSSS